MKSAIANRNLELSAKRVHDTCIVHTMNGKWQKDMSQDETTSNNEEIKPIALSIVELCFAEGIN